MERWLYCFFEPGRKISSRLTSTNDAARVASKAKPTTWVSWSTRFSTSRSERPAKMKPGLGPSTRLTTAARRTPGSGWSVTRVLGVRPGVIQHAGR
jgi:hypothetical protein